MKERKNETCNIFIDSPAPPSPVVSDQVIQGYKNTIEQQGTQIKSLEEKMAELEASLQALVTDQNDREVHFY